MLIYFINHAHRDYPATLNRFLFSTGRMPHPVGGAMGVTLSHCCEKGMHPNFDIILLNIRKTTSAGICMAVVL